MRNRSRIEIMGLILRAIDGGRSSKNQIMYKAFLGYAQTKEYLENLSDSGLLLYDVTSQKYKLTEKGKKFLQIYDEIDGMIDLSHLSEQGQYQAGLLKGEEEEEEVCLHRNEEKNHKCS